MKKIFCIFLSSILYFHIFTNIVYVSGNEENLDENNQISEKYSDSKEEIDESFNNNNQNIEGDIFENEENVNEQDYNIQEEAQENTISDNQEITLIRPQVLYQSHVEDYGWLNYVNDGAISGTTAQSKHIEAIKIKLDNIDSYSGTIKYAAHIQNYGWSNYGTNNEIVGTVGKCLAIEAIRIKLEGEITNYYDVYYRTHIEDYGWLDWAKNDEKAGSQAIGKKIEALEIKLVKKDEQPPFNVERSFITPGQVYYQTHMEDYGWQNYTGDGNVSGLEGKSKQLEAIKIGISNLPYEGGVRYTTHVEEIGWQDYKENDVLSGTTGKSYAIEAIRINLTGDVANYFDIYYRVYMEGYGWLDWAKNDGKAGSEGYALFLEAIQIKIIEKNMPAPGDTTTPFVKMGEISYSTHVENNGWLKTVYNGEVSGDIDHKLKVEAISIKLGTNDYTGNIEYSAHVQDIGWLEYVGDGNIGGTVGQDKRMEAIKIRLVGDIANYYDVYYRVYCKDIGWLDWTSNDKIAGTIGGAYDVEGIQIKLYFKNIKVPVQSSKSSLSFVNSNGFKVCYDANNTLHEDAQSLLGLKNSYTLRINKQTNIVTVLIQNGEGDYNIAYKRFVSSTGYDTPVGTYYTQAKYRWRELMGPSYGQYSTRIVGGILFHSVPYNKMNPYTLSPSMYNQLGTTCSHGCVRLTCGDAKWIYDNCVLGTRVNIVERGLDPLSKPSAQKIPSTQTWDPTDPNI